MTIGIASDHAGYELKGILKNYISCQQLTVTDFGCYSNEPCDYPEYAIAVSEWISKMPDRRRGILICGSGSGMALVANKFKLIRAVSCYSEYLVRMARAHNNANVLCLGARYTTPELAREFVSIFMNTSFDGGRHSERINKIDEI